MKTGKAERKVQAPGHKKSLSATQTPKMSQSLKKDQNFSSLSKDQTPQGYHFHSRNNSDLNYKSLHDALSQLSSQMNTPIIKHDTHWKESIMMYCPSLSSNNRIN